MARHVRYTGRGVYGFTDRTTTRGSDIDNNHTSTNLNEVDVANKHPVKNNNTVLIDITHLSAVIPLRKDSTIDMLIILIPLHTGCSSYNNWYQTSVT